MSLREYLNYGIFSVHVNEVRVSLCNCVGTCTYVCTHVEARWISIVYTEAWSLLEPIFIWASSLVWLILFSRLGPYLLGFRQAATFTWILHGSWGMQIWSSPCLVMLYSLSPFPALKHSTFLTLKRSDRDNQQCTVITD